MSVAAERPSKSRFHVLMLDPGDGNPYGIDLANAIFDAGVSVRLFAADGLVNRTRVRCPHELIAPRNGPGMHLRKAAQECRYVAGILMRGLTWKPLVLHVQWVRLRQEVGIIRLLRAMGVRIVITAHNVVPHEAHSGDVAFYRRLYSVTDRLIVHEETARDAIVRTFDISPGVIDMIPHGVATVAVPTEADRKAARATLGLRPNAPTFLFFGNLRPYKGYGTLLRAFERAARTSKEIVLVVAGWGRRDAVQEVMERISSFEPGVRERVRVFLSEDRLLPVRTGEAAFQAADCVVLPYEHISQSGVLWQAFGNARPVIASAVGGFRDAVRDGVNGRLVPAGDEQALGDALLDLAKDRASLEAWGRQARVWALGECSWEQVASKTIETYEAALVGERR